MGKHPQFLESAAAAPQAYDGADEITAVIKRGWGQVTEKIRRKIAWERISAAWSSVAARERTLDAISGSALGFEDAIAAYGKRQRSSGLYRVFDQSLSGLTPLQENAVRWGYDLAHQRWGALDSIRNHSPYEELEPFVPCRIWKIIDHSMRYGPRTLGYSVYTEPVALTLLSQLKDVYRAEQKSMK